MIWKVNRNSGFKNLNFIIKRYKKDTEGNRKQWIQKSQFYNINELHKDLIFCNKNIDDGGSKINF